MLGWKTSSQGSWSSGFTLNATVLAQEIHRSPRKMSCRCATSASLSDRERPTPEWEAYKNCSDYESPRGNPNDSSPGFLFYTFAASKWPLGIERHAFSLLKKDLSLSKSRCVFTGLRSFLSVSLSSDSATKGNGTTWVLMKHGPYHGFLCGAHGGGRQTESSRYELSSQTIIAFSLLLFISVSFSCLQAAAEDGRENGKGRPTLSQAAHESSIFLLFFLKGHGPATFVSGRILATPSAFFCLRLNGLSEEGTCTAWLISLGIDIFPTTSFLLQLSVFAPLVVISTFLSVIHLVSQAFRAYGNV